jgi:hypothetical protein
MKNLGAWVTWHPGLVGSCCINFFDISGSHSSEYEETSQMFNVDQSIFLNSTVIFVRI